MYIQHVRSTSLIHLTFLLDLPQANGPVPLHLTKFQPSTQANKNHHLPNSQKILEPKHLLQRLPQVCRATLPQLQSQRPSTLNSQEILPVCPHQTIKLSNSGETTNPDLHWEPETVFFALLIQCNWSPREGPDAIAYQALPSLPRRAMPSPLKDLLLPPHKTLMTLPHRQVYIKIKQNQLLISGGASKRVGSLNELPHSWMNSPIFLQTPAFSSPALPPLDLLSFAKKLLIF